MTWLHWPLCLKNKADCPLPQVHDERSVPVCCAVTNTDIHNRPVWSGITPQEMGLGTPAWRGRPCFLYMFKKMPKYIFKKGKILNWKKEGTMTTTPGQCTRTVSRMNIQQMFTNKGFRGRYRCVNTHSHKAEQLLLTLRIFGRRLPSLSANMSSGESI